MLKYAVAEQCFASTHYYPSWLPFVNVARKMCAMQMQIKGRRKRHASLLLLATDSGEPRRLNRLSAFSEGRNKMVVDCFFAIQLRSFSSSSNSSSSLPK